MVEVSWASSHTVPSPAVAQSLAASAAECGPLDQPMTWPLLLLRWAHRPLLLLCWAHRPALLLRWAHRPALVGARWAGLASASTSAFKSSTPDSPAKRRSMSYI